MSRLSRMWSAVLCTALILILTQQGDIADKSACPTGWFGRNCTFKCRCLNDAHCDTYGHCPKGVPCQKSFFGPGCQYRDLVFQSADRFNAPYLLDNNDSTCNPDPSSTTLALQLQLALTFTWIRVVVAPNSTFKVDEFTLLIDKQPCNNPFRFHQENVIDLVCDDPFELSSISISGTIVPYVCSIYISGGRNVALKLMAVQSSTKSTRTGPENAVDGNANTELTKGECSITNAEAKGAEWILSYDRPQMILFVKIYSEQKYFQLMKNFTLTLENTQGKDVYAWTYDGVPDEVMSVKIKERFDDIKVLRIKTSTSNMVTRPADRVLVLCEVETYGETICPDQIKFGLDCVETCTCRDSNEKVCSGITGFCGVGCRRGTFGKECGQSCSPNCLYRSCNRLTGICFRCEPGFTGQGCMKPCTEGFYGLDCKKTCNPLCGDPCNNVDGTCSNCHHHHVGQWCSECSSGSYGSHCGLKCPEHCSGDVCDVDTGLCLGCDGNRVGRDCKDCPDSHYGAMCFTKCSPKCFNLTCDKNFGNCSSCIDGYSGDSCRIAPTQFELSWYYLVPGLIVVPIIGLAAYMFTRRKKLASMSSENTVTSIAATVQDVPADNSTEDTNL